jgi:nicotinate-nucleotide adenylyltransferase
MSSAEPFLSQKSDARVAFFGGSFDPPHQGHLSVARAAREALQLDTVLFAPVGAQPLKPRGATARFDDRVAMTRLAIDGEAGFEVSLADAPKGFAGAPNYTIDTLASLRTALAPGSTLFCLMGADSFLSLPQWRRAAELPFVAPLIVATRPGQLLDDLAHALPPGLALSSAQPGTEDSSDLRIYTLSDPAGRSAPFYLLPDLDVPISATAIRESLRAWSLAGSGLLSAAVAGYINDHNLYR